MTPTAETPSFSVIIAAYQAAGTIGEAIESALAQDPPPLEVVVCDDGSTDDIDAAVAPYRDRIAFLRQENRGEASAKNAAARAASGDFVVILDADDVFLPGRLAALSELAVARPELDILTTDALLEVDGVVVRRCYSDSFRFVDDDQRAGILRENFIFGHAAVRRDQLLAAGGFDESIRWTTDWDCWLRMILDGSRAGLVPEPLSRYRLHADSLSAQREAHIAGRLQTLDKASRRRDLSRSEQEIVRGAIALNRRALRTARARASLLEGGADARRHALAVAFGAGHSAKTRAKALAAAVAPGVARRRLGAAGLETTGGIVVARAEPRMRVGVVQALRHRFRRPVRLGDLRRTTPVSAGWGADRGQPIDRYYIERYLEEHSVDIRGRVLELMDSRYTQRYGSAVSSSDVLDIDASNERATIVADLTDASGVPSASFDCIVLTQVLQSIYDFAAAVRECHRLLRPGGVLLATVPSVSRIDPVPGVEGDYWRFTKASCGRLFRDVFGEAVTVDAYGNVLTAIAFLTGLAKEELKPHELDLRDDFFPVLIAVRAVKLP